MKSKSYGVERVLMTADAVGGVWTYALDLARELFRHGVTTTLAVLGPEPSEAQREAARSIPGLDLREAPFRLEWMPDPWREVDAAGEWLLALADRIGPDVVHLNGYAHAALAWKAPTLVVGHSCVLSWWRAVKREEAPMPEYEEYARRVREGLRRADLVAAPTAAMLRELDSLYGPFREARVIPNGRTVLELRPGGKRPMIFGAGRAWDEAKNVGTLAAAAPQVEWPIYWAGPTSPPGAEERPKLRDIHLLGPLCSSVIGAWYSRSAIFVSPARYEPFGLSILEAALAGCALVLGDIPTLRELWDGAAEFVPPDDADLLASRLNALASDDARRDSLGRAARERALGYRSADMGCATLFAYQDLVQTRALPEVAYLPGVSLL